MNDEVKKDILDILNRVIEILKIKEEGDVLEIKKLSDHTIHISSIFQDSDAISMAVVIYACYKIIERHGKEESSVYAVILNHLKNAEEYLKNNDIENYRKTISNLFEEISKIDKALKEYIVNVIDKAKIKKGSKIHEHGISVARTAEILGISQWELMSYIGKTEIASEEKPTGTKERLNYARKLFGL